MLNWGIYWSLNKGYSEKYYSFKNSMLLKNWFDSLKKGMEFKAINTFISICIYHIYMCVDIYPHII